MTFLDGEKLERFSFLKIIHKLSPDFVPKVLSPQGKRRTEQETDLSTLHQFVSMVPVLPLPGEDMRELHLFCLLSFCPH